MLDFGLSQAQINMMLATSTDKPGRKMANNIAKVERVLRGHPPMSRTFIARVLKKSTETVRDWIDAGIAAKRIIVARKAHGPEPALYTVRENDRC